MVKLLISCMLVLIMSISALGQVSVGFSPLYLSRNTPILSNTFSDKGCSFELEAGIVSTLAMRGYHLYNKEYVTQLNLFDTKEKKDLPLNFTYGFSASRIEIGIPLHYKGFLFEPFFIDSYTKNYNTIKGEKIDYANDVVNHSQGLGAFYSQLLYKGNNISIKGFYTTKDNMLDFRYNKFNTKCSVGIGYTYRNYDNIKINGPSLNFLLTF